MKKAFWRAWKPDGVWENKVRFLLSLLFVCRWFFLTGFLLQTVDRKYTSFSIVYGSGDLLQFVATPDRIATNFLRLHVANREARKSLALYRKLGLEGFVEREIGKMRSVPLLSKADLTVRGAHYHFEPWAYAKNSLPKEVSNDKIAAFAAEPIRDFCFASESFSVAHRGWMGGAVDSASNCMRSGALRSLFTAAQVDKWARCLPRYSDECFALRNEVDLRDIATGGAHREMCLANKN